MSFGPPLDEGEVIHPGSRESSGPEPACGTTSWDWDDLYTRMAGRLVSLGVRRFRLSREDAEEALQRAALSIVAAAPVVRNAEAYLTATFLRESADVLRRRRLLEVREGPVPDGFERASHDCERIEVVCRFRQAFSSLSPFCRRVMRSCLLDGLDRQEAAAEASASSKTIFKRYRKCLRTLANALA
jgi:RNA polymerase sigma factor (sigma-70 family)